MLGGLMMALASAMAGMRLLVYEGLNCRLS